MILFFEPIPRYTIWGGKACNQYFHTEDRFEDGVGQIWAFSAQAGEGMSTVCSSEPFKGKTLREIWEQEPALFGGKTGVFPLIISLVAPEDDLSLQVHPDAEQAIRRGYPMGKNEAWYFIRCQEGASIVYDHFMKDREEMQAYVQAERWDEIPKHRPVRDGDFVYIPAGMMHAMGKGVVVYEIQQSTDVTYRFYDYHRKDKNGNERPLDLEDAIECLHYDGAPKEAQPSVAGPETIYISNDSFTVSRLEVKEPLTWHTEPYRLATVTVGAGTADGIPVREGSSFLIPSDTKVDLDGNMEIMLTFTA